MKKFKDFLKSKNVTEEAFKTMEAAEQAKLHSEFLNEMGDEIDKKASSEDLESLKSELETEKGTNATLKTEVEELKEIVKTQGEAIKDGANSPENAGFGVAKSLKEELEAIHKSSNEGTLNGKVTIKADAIGVNANAGAGIAGAITTIGNYFAQLIPGIAKKPVPKSNILDEIDMLPLNADRLVSISETETVNIAVTAEGAVKPESTVIWAAIDEPAEAVATTWKTTTKMRRFFAMFVTSFLKTLQSYFDKKLPQLVIAKIKANATAFTPVPAQAVHTAPNNFDAIIAVISSLVKLGYAPNSARMSVYAWENMQTLKASDGHYMLENKGSINLLNNTINFGDDVSVRIRTDVELGNDDLIVGDFKTSVKAGIDTATDYTEFYSGTDGNKNLLSHRLEKFFACIVPVATRTGIVSDTFTNIKAGITAD
ncbi:hypothetical protein [Epilithonimonas caeni]|uniref:hypothetical protein n=1 Tax=Epilithonimonas caeni TaxID=365343 RepID=UPI0003FE5781|nr:hypothetical protein [Epilithonimonas caeni]